MKALLELENVSKRYGELVAVNDVSLEIEPGEILALLGPNGAGKTTLIGAVSGLTAGFEGRIRVAGFDVVDDYRITRRLVGLVPQELNHDAFFTVRESLEYQSGYFGVRPDSTKIDALLRQFSLMDKANERSRWLSGGMKRRLMICKALVHDPVLLFLDEPTAGVDVELRDELWDYVRGLRARGTTIVLTTHYLEEAEALADRIGIMDRGTLVRVQAREAMMEEFGRRWGEVCVRGEISDELLARLPDEVSRQGSRLKIVWGRGEADGVDRIMRVLYAGGVEIEGITTGRSSLEEIFKELVGSRGES